MLQYHERWGFSMASTLVRPAMRPEDEDLGRDTLDFFPKMEEDLAICLIKNRFFHFSDFFLGETRELLQVMGFIQRLWNFGRFLGSPPFISHGFFGHLERFLTTYVQLGWSSKWQFSRVYPNVETPIPEERWSLSQSAGTCCAETMGYCWSESFQCLGSKRKTGPRDPNAFRRWLVTPNHQLRIWRGWCLG